MKTRSKRELLKFVIDKLETKKLHIRMRSNGLCHFFYILNSYGLITNEEHEIISNCIYKNRPSIKSKLFPHYTTFGISGIVKSSYYYEPNNWEIRLKWLKYLLNKELKKDGKNKV